MYKFAHFLRDHLPFIWDFVDWMNGVLFTWRYGRKMKALPEMLEAVAREYQIVEMSSIQATDLERFFAAQPEESFKFFKPHGFDAKSLRKLQKNKAFLAFIVKDGSSPVGYFFLRSFFFGKAYLGHRVDPWSQDVRDYLERQSFLFVLYSECARDKNSRGNA